MRPTSKAFKQNVTELKVEKVEQRWLRHAEAAEYLRVKPATLRAWRDAAKIRFYKIGGDCKGKGSLIYYDIKDLDKFVQNGRVI